MSAAPTSGDVLGGKYRVVRAIGEGGMGVVLEAENTLSGKRVAIKWLQPSIAAQSDAVERMLREARASARVRHPNVVDVYDVVQEEGTVFLVMELLDGEPLGELIERGDAAPHQLVSLLSDAMRGVAAAHREGVVHRDIKPDNIFLAREGDRPEPVAKVLDFGISKVSDKNAMTLTATGATVGTPLYMSYEQLCGVRDIDARTDVYSFAVVLYEALTGRPPFDAETYAELIVKITEARVITPRTLRPGLPLALDGLILAAMAKERDQRTGTLEAFIEALEPFCDEAAYHGQNVGETGQRGGVRDVKELGTTPMAIGVSSVVPAPPRSRTGWIVVGSALLLIAGLLIWRLGAGGARPEDDAMHAAPPIAPPVPTAAEQVEVVAPGSALPRGAMVPADPVPAPAEPAREADAPTPTATPTPTPPTAPVQAIGPKRAAKRTAVNAQPLGAMVAAPPSPPAPAPPEPPAVEEVPRPKRTAPAKRDAVAAEPKPRLRAGRPRSEDF